MTPELSKYTFFKQHFYRQSQAEVNQMDQMDTT